MKYIEKLYFDNVKCELSVNFPHFILYISKIFVLEIFERSVC